VARYRLTRAAARDLAEIGLYTQQVWGVAQRRRYLRRLDRRMTRLADRPGLGAPRDDIRTGYRSFREGRHIIFYRTAVEGIEIVRVLHESMDVQLHIEPGNEQP
jgi:toxin ParE1/3/4